MEGITGSLKVYGFKLVSLELLKNNLENGPCHVHYGPPGSLPQAIFSTILALLPYLLIHSTNYLIILVNQPCNPLDHR